MTRLVHLLQTEFEKETSLLTADQADYKSFLAEYGITEEHVRAATYFGENPKRATINGRICIAGTGSGL